MKKYIYILVFSVLMGGLTSCNDWLDVSPKDRIPADKMFESEAGFKDILTGAYLKLATAHLYAGDLKYGYIDELAGLYCDYPSYNNNSVYNQAIVFDYTNQFLGKKDNIYLEMYNVVANINNLLQNLEKHRDVLKSPHYYECMKGEALGLRAFVYFDLLRLFGPIYSEHPNDAAIPYKTTFDKEATPVLPANKVVEKILEDLKAAEAILAEHDPCDFQTGEENRTEFLSNREFRMNIYAVKAMLARVYCYAGQKELAIQYAQQVIDANKFFTLYKSQTPSNYNSIRYGEMIFGLSVHQLGNLLSDNAMDMNETRPQRRYGMKSEMFDRIYEGYTSDWRQNIVAFKWDDSHEYAFCLKYNQERLAYTTSENAIPLIRLPEMYYIIAECTPSAQESADILNKVRQSRGIPYSEELQATGFDSPDANSVENKLQTRRINEIMKEYRKEFYAEGQLFFFLKAHNYSTYYGCGLANMTSKEYQMPLPDNEKIFGNNSTTK